MSRIRDPIHGFIHLSDAELKIIDTPAFQRLRNIKQLSFTYYVYPGAMHSRFEHSLGVMEMASCAFDLLVTNHKEELEQSFKAIGFTLDKAKDILRLAGLLHDIGHLPFSHGGESVLPDGKKHEHVSVYLIKDMYEKIIDTKYFEGATAAVIGLIDKEESIPELRLLKRLLSGQIDVDRMDYLLRDSHFCGVDYGKFDHTRLLESIAVIKQNGYYNLAIDRGGIHALESLILARYYMFTQVYGHRTRRIYDRYLTDYLKLWNEGQYNDFSNTINYDDVTLIGDLRRDSVSSDIPLRRKLADRIINRNHHSVVFETSDHAGYEERRDAVDVYEKLMAQFGQEIDLIIDEPKKENTIHNFLTPQEYGITGDEFLVLDKRGSMRKEKLLTNESAIIRNIPKHHAVVRVYATGTDEVIETIKAFIKK